MVFIFIFHSYAVLISYSYSYHIFIYFTSISMSKLHVYIHSPTKSVSPHLPLHEAWDSQTREAAVWKGWSYHPYYLLCVIEREGNRKVLHCFVTPMKCHSFEIYIWFVTPLLCLSYEMSLLWIGPIELYQVICIHFHIIYCIHSCSHGKG